MSEETKDVGPVSSTTETSAPTADAPSAPPAAAPTTPSIPRPLELIKQEYTNTAAQLGNIVFQIALLKGQRDMLMQQLDKLGIEGNAATPPPAAKPQPPKLVPPAPKAGSDGV